MNIGKVLAGDPSVPLKIAIPDWMSGSAVGAPNQATANAQAAISDDLIFDDNTNDYGATAGTPGPGLAAGMVLTNPNLVIIDYGIGIRMMPTNANAQSAKYALSSYGNGGAIPIATLSGDGTTASVGLASGHGVTPETSTTVAVASDGATLPTTPITVVDTTAFPTSGTLVIQTTLGFKQVAYTGKSGTQFTGCTGGAGVIHTGYTVSLLNDSKWDGSLAITIAGSDVAGFNGTWLVSAVPDATHFTFASATNATAHATGTCTGYSIIGNAGNPIADSRQNEYRQAVLNGYGPNSGVSVAGIGANRHLFQYPDYQGVLLDTAGESPVDGAYALPSLSDPATGVTVLMDRYMSQNIDAMHYVAMHLARVDPGNSFATLVSPTTPDSNPAGSNRGMNPVTGYRYPTFCNALGRGDQYWGAQQYATVAVTSSTVSGTKITFVTGTAHGFGVDDWVIGLKLNAGAYDASDGLYRVISVTNSTTFVVETNITGLSSRTGAAGSTVQRAAPNRLVLRVTQGAMMESTFRFSSGPLTSFPTVAIFQQTINAMIDCQLQGCLFFWCTKVWVAHNHQAGNQDGTKDGDSTAGTGGSGGIEDPKVDQAHKLALAGYLLGNLGRSYFHFRHDDTIERISVIHRYYTAIRTKLGVAVDNWNTQPSPDGLNGGITGAAVSGVYKRQFTKGIALVNPSGGALNFALPGGLGTLKNIDTRDATSYTGTISVPANTGLILTQ